MMHMSLRWFGSKHDTVTLQQIRQIPGVEGGVITTLYDIPAGGEAWPIERIREIKKEVEAADLKVLGIESVNIHDAIKIGGEDRDKYIANYIQTLENLGKEGITTVCYNFMPVFDWTRTELAKMRSDGSTVLAYDQKVVDGIDPESFLDQTNNSSQGFEMPGWEPERLAKIKELMEAIRMFLMKNSLRTLCIFSKQSSQPVRPTGSRWQSTRMIRLGPCLDYHVSSPARKKS